MTNRYTGKLLAVNEDVTLMTVSKILFDHGIHGSLRENSPAMKFFQEAVAGKPISIEPYRGINQITENQKYRLLLCAFLAILSKKEIDEMKKEWSAP